MNIEAMTEGNNDGITPAYRDVFVSFSGCSRSRPGSKFAMAEAILVPVFAQHVVNFSFDELRPLEYRTQSKATRWHDHGDDLEEVTIPFVFTSLEVRYN